MDAFDAISSLDIIQFQTDDLFNSVVGNPGTFGLINVTTPCYSGFVEPNPGGIECPNPDEFLFWDIVHPTATGHAILADAITIAVVPEPSTLPLLLASLLALAGVFRKSSVKTN